jgi:tRNA dimethylallyltransferase
MDPDKPRIVCVIGPTASGKSAHAVERALQEGGEVISVDSRQVYRTLDIGTEKMSTKEMRGVPHHLIDIRDPEDAYSAGEFVADATRLIKDMHERGILPILAGGTHFYFDALLYGLPADTPPNDALRSELEVFTNDELLTRLRAIDSARADALDPENRRRIIRALEIVQEHGSVPERATESAYEIEWVVIDPGRDELKARLALRLTNALSRGLVEEVSRVRARVGDARLEELGLEYRIVGEYLREEFPEVELYPRLLAKLSQYARRQRAWMRKLV